MPLTIKQLEILKQNCKIRGYSMASVPAAPVVKKNKFGNVPVEFDGKKFQSTKERDRYVTLRMLLTAGEIKDLACQVEFILETDDKKVCSYISDFCYMIVKTGQMKVEDVKSNATRKLAVYRLKKKLMLACLGIEIKEV